MIKKILRIIYHRPTQIRCLINLSKQCSGLPYVGLGASLMLDNLVHYLFGIEVSSRTLDIVELHVGHSTGVVLGGNGIKCNGKLHVSSGVVFGRKYYDPNKSKNYFFDIDGVSWTSVVVSPLS